MKQLNQQNRVEAKQQIKYGVASLTLLAIIALLYVFGLQVTNTNSAIDASAEVENNVQSRPVLQEKVQNKLIEDLKPETIAVDKTPTAEENIADSAPAGYVDTPPLCGLIYKTTAPGSALPWTIEAYKDQYQDDVTVNSYDWYLDGTLVQSSSSATYNFNVPGDVETELYVILNTNFGKTLKSDLCTATLNAVTQL